eukprot:8767119-Alexandrium_andersonii.AAC.1
MERFLPDDGVGPPAPERPPLPRSDGPASPRREWSVSATSELDLNSPTSSSEGSSGEGSFTGGR